MAITRLKSKILYSVYLGGSQVQHASAHLVGSPGLHGREGVQGHLGRACHALQHAVHRRG